MKRIILGAVTALLVAPAFAISSEGLEVMIKARDSGSSDVSKWQGLALTTYYRGVYETLAAMPDSEGRITFHGRYPVCLPTKDVLTPELVRGLIEGELKRWNDRSQTPDPPKDWKQKTPVLLLITSLSRTFPCP